MGKAAANFHEPQIAKLISHELWMAIYFDEPVTRPPPSLLDKYMFYIWY